MARRTRSGPADEFLDIVATMPWWAGVLLALVSHLLLHRAAAQVVSATMQPGQVSAMAGQTLWKTVRKLSSCPTCAKPMVRRTAKRRANAGSEFWGCRGYSACGGTRPIG